MALPSYDEALLDADKARVLFDASKGGNVRGITEDHRFALAEVFNGAARPVPSIKFERVTRDCPHNDDLRKDGETRGLIYDFDVMIDGERRAQMSRVYTGKGYTVQDAGGRPIDPPLPHYQTGRRVDNQAEFETVVSMLLDAGKIPTMARMEKLRAEEAAANEAKRAAVAEELRVHRIEAAGVDLYEALKPLVQYMKDNGGDAEFHDPRGGWLSRALAAMAKAELTDPGDEDYITASARG